MYIQLFILLLSYLGIIIFKEYGTFRQRQQSRKKYIIFIMILFIIQSGLRHLAVGDDTFAYYEMFEDIKNTSWEELISSFSNYIQYDEGKDPGYQIVEKIFSTIIPSFRLFLLAIAILFFTSLGRLLYKYTHSQKEILVAVTLYQCLYYSFMSITGIRQTIATSLLLFAVPYLTNRQWIKGFILIILAATQHKSALLFGAFVFLPYLKNTKLILILSFIGFIPMTVLGSQIAQYFMIGTRFEQYSNYLTSYDGGGAYSFMAFILLLSISLYLQNKNILKCGTYNYIYINAISIALLLTPLTIINPSNMRIVQYYSIFALIILPKVCTIYNKLFPKIDLHKLIFLILTIYIIIGRSNEYGFFWEEMQLGPQYENNKPFSEFDL